MQTPRSLAAPCGVCWWGRALGSPAGRAGARFGVSGASGASTISSGFGGSAVGSMVTDLVISKASGAVVVAAAGLEHVRVLAAVAKVARHAAHVLVRVRTGLSRYRASFLHGTGRTPCGPGREEAKAPRGLHAANGARGTRRPQPHMPSSCAASARPRGTQGKASRRCGLGGGWVLWHASHLSWAKGLCVLTTAMSEVSPGLGLRRRASSGWARHQKRKG